MAIPSRQPASEEQNSRRIAYPPGGRSSFLATPRKRHLKLKGERLILKYVIPTATWVSLGR